jgi:hypothetical protein
MHGAPANAQLWTNLIPLLFLGVVILRNSRRRTLRLERLWISPFIVMAMTALAFATSPPPGFVGIVLDFVALGIGCGLGWWRARASQFSIDPATHVITSKVSAAGMFLILGIFAGRYVLRSLLTADSSALHLSAIEASDSFLILAVGLVSAQRIEWLIRARRMLAQARGAQPV